MSAEFKLIETITLKIVHASLETSVVSFRSWRKSESMAIEFWPGLWYWKKKQWQHPKYDIKP